MPRIQRAKIKFLSLCPRGANMLPAMYKSDDPAQRGFVVRTISKEGEAFDEKGELTCIVYAPEIRDAQGDIASAKVIKEMMFDAAKDGFEIDLRHDEKALSKEDVFVAESFIVQKNDPRFVDQKDSDGNPVDVTGAWAVNLKIQNPALRKAYRDGEWDGISMGGHYVVQPDDDDGLIRKFLKALGVSSPQTPNESETDMTPEQIAALRKDVVADVVEALKPADEATKKPVAKGFEPAPFKQGDDPKVHVLEVAKARAMFDLDYSDMDAVNKALATSDAIDEQLMEIAAQKEKGNEEIDKEAGVHKEDTPEVKSLKRRLHKAQKASAQDQSPQGVFKKSSEADLESGNGELDMEMVKQMAGIKSD